MTAHYESKHGQVSKMKEELFMAFTDLRNFASMAPEQLKADIQADYDNLSVSVQGFRIAVRVDERRPYTLIRLGSSESPVEFIATLHFDPSAIAGKTDFSIEVDANINFMMKTMLGNKVRQALDKIVDGLVGASEGRMPENMDSNIF